MTGVSRPDSPPRKGSPWREREALPRPPKPVQASPFESAQGGALAALCANNFISYLLRKARTLLLSLVLLGMPTAALANGQMYEPLAAAVRDALHAAISDVAAPQAYVEDAPQTRQWLEAMSPRLLRRIPDEAERIEFLRTVHYEASRAGLDPQLVLGVIQVESGFRKYAVSSAGARGFMQVMPFWVDVIGAPAHNLFHLRTNLRYGCIILRHYLDIERGDLFRALGRYNGSLGQARYPELVRAAWQGHWDWTPPRLATMSTAQPQPADPTTSEPQATAPELQATASEPQTTAPKLH